MIYKYDNEIKLPISIFGIWNFQFEPEIVINELSQYFYYKKAIKGNFYDDEYNIIDSSEYIFIDFDNITKIVDNEKVTSNDYAKYITQLIKRNDRLFLSIDKINREIKNLETDLGIYKLKNKLSFNNSIIDIEVGNLEFEDIAKLIRIKFDNKTDIEKTIIYINKLLHENKGKEVIIYINSLSDIIIDWIISLQMCDRLSIVLSNENIISNLSQVLDVEFHNINYFNTRTLKLSHQYDDINYLCYALSRKTIRFYDYLDIKTQNFIKNSIKK